MLLTVVLQLAVYDNEMCVARQPFAAAVRNIDGGMLVVVLRMILIMMMVRMITLVVMKSPHFTIFSNMIRLTLEVHLRHLLVVSSPHCKLCHSPLSLCLNPRALFCLRPPCFCIATTPQYC